MPDGIDKDVNQEKETPSGSSPDKKTDLTDPGAGKGADEGSRDKGTGDGRGDDKAEPMIPKHRLDEEIEKRRKLEQDLGALNDKFTRMGEALTGKNKSEAADEGIDALAQKYNVPTSFVEDMLAAAEKRAQKSVSGDLGTLKKAQADAAYERELNALADEFPDAADMSKDDKETLRKMAFDPKYSRTPLSDIYKIVAFGRSPGKRKTVEGSRSGAGRASSDGEPDISSMTIEEFEKFSNGLAKQGR